MPFLIDGSTDFSGGQNSGLTPDKIGKNQYEKGINTSSHNGSLQPRPRFRHVYIRVDTQGTEAGVSYQEIFDKGKFQGERVFQADQRSFLITVRSGIIFKVDLRRGVATVLRTTTDDRIALRHRRVPIKQAGEYMVIWDWPNMPVVIEKDTARRSDWNNVDAQGLPQPEVPQSRLGVFVQSRLWVANGTNEFTAGDFVGDIQKPEAPITFTEVFTSNAPYIGQVFNLGFGFGNTKISAMGFISSRNSQSKIQATRYGPLYVATRKSIHLYNAELPRDQWLQTTFGSIELWGTGIVGERAHELIGSDIIFQDTQGHLHSFTKNQNDERSGWATTIISREVDDWLYTVNKDYLDVGFVTYFDRLVLAGARPIRIPIRGYRGQVIYDYVHEGMVALELDNVSTITTPASPSWAGLWTGIRPMEASVVNDSLYITSKDVDGFNRTYVVDKEAQYDEWKGIYIKTKGRVYFRSFSHEQPFTDKFETSVDINLANVTGDLNLKMFRKPLHANKFTLWGEYDHVQKCTDVCINEQLSPITGVGYRVLAFGDPVKVGCNSATGESEQYYRETQLMLEFEGGDWRVDRVKLKGEVQGEADSDGTPCTAEVKEQPTADCSWISDWDLYTICPKV
jgi:hypothetical protein